LGEEEEREREREKEALKKISNFSKSQTICSYNVCVTNGGQVMFSLCVSGMADTI